MQQESVYNYTVVRQFAIMTVVWGIVGMTVSEEAHRPQLIGGRSNMIAGSTSPVVEFTAVGTAIAPLAPGDPRRAKQTVKPLVVVPLDR